MKAMRLDELTKGVSLDIQEDQRPSFRASSLKKLSGSRRTNRGS